MAKRKTRTIASRTTTKSFPYINWQESYAPLVLGAIIVVILGLLVANYFTKRNQEIGNEGVQTTQEEQAAQQQEQEKANQAQGNYKVVAGDSLSAIAQKQYGSQDYWPIIARANNIANPNILFADSQITLPSKAEADTIRQDMTATSIQVKEGDTISAIAERVYGDLYKWPQIAKANNVGYLPNGNPLIFAGSTLAIPR